MFLRNTFHNFQNIKPARESLYHLSAMIFCFVVFDGILSFATPLLITQAGISESVMGIIIGTSSIFGALFDFLLCLVIKRPHYRRLFILMFILSLFYPFILWQANSVLFFISVMAVWGLYYDLYNIGTLDFVGREISKKDHASSYGIIRAFHSLGYTVAPLIAGLAVGAYIGSTPFIVAWIFLIIGLIFFRNLLQDIKKNKGSEQEKISSKDKNPLSYFKEMKKWIKVGRLILPLLLATCMLNIFDATFWTIGPLISEKAEGMISLGSFFIISYQLPPLLVGWFIGKIALKRKKEKIAFLSLMIGSLIFMSFSLIDSKLLLIGASFLASFMIAIAWPSISATCADHICDSPEKEKEVETLQDFFTNLGYVIGPIFAGYFSQRFGHVQSFSLIGAIGLAVSVILLIFVTKKATSSTDVIG